MADSDDITPGKSPAFQFYPKDFLSDPNVLVMSLQERGAYITLLCVCWQRGFLPNDKAQLARLCGVPLSAFCKLWPPLEACFRVSGDIPTHLVHPRLERERAKQDAFRRRQSDNGRLGGRPRKPDVTQIKPKPLQNKTQTITQLEAKKSSALCDLQSADSSPVRKEHEPTDARVHERLTALGTNLDLTERAGRFLEHYAELHEKLRRGARYVGRMHVDYQEALQLVATFEDERLDKLATVWLTTNHDFAEGGTRTIPKFRSMVSWCDERLRERGL